MNAAVAAMVASVRAEGDAALIELTREFPPLDLRQVHLKVTAAEIDVARGQSGSGRRLKRWSWRMSASSTTTSGQLPKNDLYRDRLGVELGTR